MIHIPAKSGFLGQSDTADAALDIVVVVIDLDPAIKDEAPEALSPVLDSKCTIALTQRAFEDVMAQHFLLSVAARILSFRVIACDVEAAARRRFSVTSGTIFASRQLAFADLLGAICLFANMAICTDTDGQEDGTRAPELVEGAPGRTVAGRLALKTPADLIILEPMG